MESIESIEMALNSIIHFHFYSRESIGSRRSKPRFRLSLSRPKEATGTICRKFLSAEDHRIRVAFVAFGRACPIDEEGFA